ncbi:MAG: FtsQ-type POTRA domain-containing protein [Acidimicrobiales bacterium]|jgi:cell division protein FtsQ
MSPPRADGGSIDPRIRQRREQVERTRTQKRLRRAAVVAGVVVLIGIGALVLHTPWFEARVVTVTGSHPNTSDEAIESAAGLLHHPPLVSVDPGPTAARVESLPFIASARVTRHWPDSVTISVTERIPMATMAGPGTAWSTLDGMGRTLAVTAARPDLPVLVVHAPAGTAVPAPVGGTVAPDADPGLVVAATLPPAFVHQVVSVTVAGDGTVSLGLDSDLTVLLGTVSDLTAKYEDVAAIIAHANLDGARTIDVTVPESPTVGP